MLLENTPQNGGPTGHEGTEQAGEQGSQSNEHGPGSDGIAEGKKHLTRTCRTNVRAE